MRNNFTCFAENYVDRLGKVFDKETIGKMEESIEVMRECWINKNEIFLCGNGGSAANAIHIANDLHYGAASANKKGLIVTALPSNTAIITCLANDTGYENIFSNQIAVKGRANDVLVVLSGSGNSPNVIKAIKVAKKIGLKTISITSFDGGECMRIADTPIWTNINDMQIAEDAQLIIGHMWMQYLRENNK